MLHPVIWVLYAIMPVRKVSHSQESFISFSREIPRPQLHREACQPLQIFRTDRSNKRNQLDWRATTQRSRERNLHPWISYEEYQKIWQQRKEGISHWNWEVLQHCWQIRKLWKVSGSGRQSKKPAFRSKETYSLHEGHHDWEGTNGSPLSWRLL